MNRHWQILALLLLAFMAPASMCCQLMNGCAAQQCSSCPAQEHHDQHLPVACPSDSIAHSQVPAPVVLPAAQMIELTSIIQEMMRLNELAASKAPPVPFMTVAPPELRTTWVFKSRAALPARAPSALA